MTGPDPTPSPTGAAAAGDETAAWPVLRPLPGLLGLVVVFLLVQHGCEDEWRAGLAVGLIVLAGAGAVLLWRARATLRHTLCAAPFAVALLASIAVATALGTFVPQDFPASRLGGLRDVWVQRLFLNDTFHSFWFAGLVATLVLSLLLVLLRRPFWRAPYWGFLLVHAGMVVTVAGACVGLRCGTQGTLALRKGEQHSAFVPGARSGNPGARTPLGFAIRLDDFDVQKYPDELRFVLYRKQGDDDPAMLRTFRLDQAETWTAVPCSPLLFRVREFTPATGQPGRGRHLIETADSPTPLEVQVGQSYPVPGTARSFRVVQFLPHFSFDIQQKRAFSLTDEPRNPALLVEEPGPGPDAAPRRQWLFARAPGHSQREGDLPLKYVYLDTGRVPTVTIQIKPRDDSAPPGKAVLAASAGREGVCWLTEDLALVFENKRGEPKVYRSRIAVVEGDKVVREASVVVNEPLEHRGYVFYQSDWKSDDLSYSGLKVVRDPGLGIVYAGLIMVSVGVVFVLYLRPRLRRAAPAGAEVRP